MVIKIYQINILKYNYIFRFNEDFNFPGVIGCVDCTHVAIFTPTINDDEFPENIYVNRKGYHSINVQLVRYISVFYVFICLYFIWYQLNKYLLIF